MKWLLDLIWPKSPKTMAEVESSYGNSPYENLQPPAWNVSAAVNNGFLSAVLGRALVEAGDNQRAVLLVTRLNTVSVLSSLPSDVTILYGLMECGDFFVTFAQPDRRLTFTIDRNGTDSWHSVENVAKGGALLSGPLTLEPEQLAYILRSHFGEWVRRDVAMKPPVWKDSASNGPVVPDVDSLSRQVVALREEVARVKAEAMRAILEARHEAARDAAEWRGERDALTKRVERVESFFPVGWGAGTTYHKYIGDMYACVYPSVLLGKNDYTVSVSCVNDAGVGVTEERRFATLSEAMARGEQLAEELRVAMEDRTVVGGPVVMQKCSEVVRG